MLRRHELPDLPEVRRALRAWWRKGWTLGAAQSPRETRALHQEAAEAILRAPVATFAATRSANRASRIAERSLLATLRPVLMGTQLGDPRQKIGFADDAWFQIEGPQAVLSQSEEAIYLAVGLRNFGNGIAILQAWHAVADRIMGRTAHAPIEEFRPQTRALYVPPGGLSFWQGALRDASEPLYDQTAEAIKNRTAVTIELLYTDMNGGQQTISRLAILPSSDDRWIASVSQHWVLDEHTPLRAANTVR